MSYQGLMLIKEPELRWPVILVAALITAFILLVAAGTFRLTLSKPAASPAAQPRLEGALRPGSLQIQGACVILVPDLEAALGGFPPGASLTNRQADDLAHESFRELTHLRVFDDGRRERARAAADE